MDSEIIGAIIGPFLSAMLGLVAYATREWQQKRHWENQRDRALEQAHAEAKYIDTWLSALHRLDAVDPQVVADREARAFNDLERSYQVMALDLSDDGQRPPSKTLTEHAQSIMSAVLLLGLQRGTAKAMRMLYYLLLLVAVGWMGAIIAVFEAKDDLAMEIVGSFLLTVAGFLPAALMGAVVRSLDKPRSQPRPVAPVPPLPGGPPPPFAWDIYAAGAYQPPHQHPSTGADNPPKNWQPR